MKTIERTCSFDCGGDRLFGIITEPAASSAPRGMLMAVGGPQYRAGSHRQYTLMARHFAARGTPVMRFDFRGMGDSEGEPRNFDQVEDDLRAAIDQFMREAPGVREVILFGLCDAASAVALYGCTDERVSGLLLLNPWVRSEQGATKATLKHYYVRRLFQPELWRKIARAEFRYREALQSLLSLIVKARARREPEPAVPAADPDRRPIGHRMLARLQRFHGRVLIVLSSADLTAQEFSDLLSGSRAWRALTAQERFSTFSLPGADHTFSRREWRDQATAIIDAWNATW